MPNETEPIKDGLKYLRQIDLPPTLYLQFTFMFMPPSLHNLSSDMIILCGQKAFIDDPFGGWFGGSFVLVQGGN